MADRPQKPLFPNPFYVVLMITSTLFVITALAYVVSPWVGADAAGGRRAVEPGKVSRAIADWLDRNGPLALGAEFVLMLVFSLFAMATDQWFPTKPKKSKPSEL